MPVLNTIFTTTIYKNKVQVFFFKCHGVCYERAFHWYLYNLPQTENRVSTNDFVERNFFLCKILIWFITFHSKLILFKRISKLKASCLAKVTLSKLKNTNNVVLSPCEKRNVIRWSQGQFLKLIHWQYRRWSFELVLYFYLVAEAVVCRYSVERLY